MTYNVCHYIAEGNKIRSDNITGMGGSAQKLGDESDDDYITKHRPCRTIPSWPNMQFSLGKEVHSMVTS